MNRSTKKNADKFKTFLGNKKEGQGFADKRKKKAAYEYLKLLKKEKTKDLKDGREPTQHRPVNLFSPHHGKKFQAKKGHAFSVAEKVARKKKEEKQKKVQVAQNKKKETDEALGAYKTKKQEKYLKICKRTRNGQPVMRHQMEVLLDKIKKQKESTV